MSRFHHALLLMLAALIMGAAAPVPRLTATGWGPLRIGMARTQVTRLLGDDRNPHAVGGPKPALCDEFQPRRAPAGLRVMIERGQLTRISVRRGIATDRGIRVGDPVSRVRAAYRGQHLVDEPHKYVDAPARYLTWRRPGSGPERGIRYEIDAASRVSAIHAGGTSIRYVEGCL